MTPQIGGGGGEIGVDLNLLPPGGGVQALPPPPPAADRISSLSETARLRIVRFLPFKTVLALRIVSSSWFGVVSKARRFRDGVLGIHILSAQCSACPLFGCVLGTHLHSALVRVLANKLHQHGRGPGYRLTRFMVCVELLHVPGVQEADIFLLEEALASGRIIVSEFDDPATQPFHSEVFINV
jgi:hypothetical protein